MFHLEKQLYLFNFALIIVIDEEEDLNVVKQVAYINLETIYAFFCGKFENARVHFTVR